MAAGERRDERGIVLDEGLSGSRLLREVLAETVEAYPEVFSGVRIPRGAKAFKKSYGDHVVRFEAARAASEQRAEIARSMVSATESRMAFADGAGGRVPLAAHLADAGSDEVALTRRDLGGRVGLRPEVSFDGRTYTGSAVVELAELLRERAHMTEAAVQGVRWIAAQAGGATLDLSGERFVVMGAAAELAPTESLLRAGATVLWIDVAPPDAWLAARGGDRALAGTVVTAEGVGDLLAEPAAAAAAIRTFARGEPVHLGLYAYAPGASRELRLAAGMDAIVRSLPPEIVGSVSLYISPTTPAVVQPEDRAAARARAGEQPLWKSALSRVSALPMPGHVEVGRTAVARSVISLQGPGYQGAQYLAKVAAAEAYAVHGLGLNGSDPAPVTVSANVAGITNTKSLEHPLFQAAFVGAPTFGVQIFETPTTRSLSALMMVRDVLDPDAPGAATSSRAGAEKAGATLSQQVHGGVFSMPWVFEGAVRSAAVVGLAKKPWVLWRGRRA